MGAKKKSDTPEISPLERASACRSELNAKFRNQIYIRKASEIPNVQLYKRIPTGITTLDVALKGGWPCAGLSVIQGPPSAFKSGLYWLTIAQLQKMLGPNSRVLLAMSEMPADKSQGRLLGAAVALSDYDIDMQNLGREQQGLPKLTEEEVAALKTEVGVIDEVHADSVEHVFDAILHAVDCCAYDLIIYDSFGTSITEAAADADSITQKFYGGAASVNTAFVNKLTAKMLMPGQSGIIKDACILGVNQVRANIGNQWQETKNPGGYALAHAKLVGLDMTPGGHDKEEVDTFTTEGNKKKMTWTGRDFNWRIEKGKSGMHEGAAGSFSFQYADNIPDFCLDILIASINSGVITQKGMFYYIPNPGYLPSKEEYVTVQGKDNAVAFIKADMEARVAGGFPDSIYTHLRNRCFQAHNIHVNYDWSKNPW